MTSPEIQDTPTSTLGLTDSARLELIDLLGRVQGLLGSTEALSDVRRAFGQLEAVLNPAPAEGAPATPATPDTVRAILVAARGRLARDIELAIEDLRRESSAAKASEEKLAALYKQLEEIDEFLGAEVTA